MTELVQFFFNHWALCLAFIVIVLLIFINETLTKKTQGKSISPQTAVDKINHEDAVVIDLRDPTAFSGGHIINAIRASSEDFQQGRMDKYKTTPLILVCTKGIQAQSVATTIKASGFLHPFVLAGGQTGWVEASMPVVKGK